MKHTDDLLQIRVWTLPRIMATGGAILAFGAFLFGVYVLASLIVDAGHAKHPDPEPRTESPTQPVVRDAPHSDPVAAEPNLVAQAYELGQQTARVRDQIDREKARLEELHQVVCFKTCVENLSGEPFKQAFESDRYNKICADRVQAMTAMELETRAEAIIKQKAILP